MLQRMAASDTERVSVSQKQAKVKEQTTVSKVANWPEWFQMCGRLGPDLEAYEELVRQYYMLQCSHTEKGKQCARKLYLAHQDTAFYKKKPVVPRWLRKKLMGFAALGFLLVSLLGLLILLIPIFVSNGSLPPVWQMVACSVPFGTLAALLIYQIPSRLHRRKVQKLWKQMGALEETLKPWIVLIPPKYRNSESVQVFFDIFTSYDIYAFSEAVQTCDNHLVQNNMDGLYLAVMFDEPYENTLLAHGNETEYRPEDDPDLPEDIASKTFSGALHADKQLAQMVGLPRVKDSVSKMKNRIKFYANSPEERKSGSHMVFLGPPGTGKTTVARILTRILYDYGYIKENKCVEIDGGYLRSPFEGQTVPRANAIFRYAMGGVLFIDEAYILSESSGKSGSEAIGVMLKAMEDHRGEFVCILAGYEDRMNRMLASNEGFESRIKYKLYFEPFTSEELMQVFMSMLKKQVTDGNRYKIEKSAMKLVQEQLAKEADIPSFGNARSVRNLWDKLLDIHADLFMKKVLPEEKRYVITKQDVMSYIDDRKAQLQEDTRNYIASRNMDHTIISLQELQGKTKPGSEHPEEDLEQMIGLSMIKKEVAEMKAQFEFYDGKLESEGCHMLFEGPPGTGKTTVAAIMTGYLYQMGLISQNSYVDINGDFLRGSYQGHTGKRTEAVIQYAQGMVLFIDEAYTLTAKDGPTDNFGQEAIGVLVDAMEKYRKNFVVILAGYEDEMKVFLNVNSGLESRINLTFHFETYTPKEMAQMFQQLAKAKGFSVDKKVWIPLQQYLAKASAKPRFGNGRFVRNLFESVRKAHIVNYSKQQLSENQKYVISAEDLQMVLNQDA